MGVPPPLVGRVLIGGPTRRFARVVIHSPSFVVAMGIDAVSGRP
jgi:hypothetical protein